MHASVLLVITTDESSSLWNISRESLEKITQAFSRYSSCFMRNVEMGRTSGRRKVDRPRDFCEAKNAIICGVSKKVTGSIAIDLSKAFDSICHNLLLAKLRAYGVGEEAIDFLYSYLSGRKQRVKVNRVFSDWLPVYCGVPQGSLLGPFLFNVFINDLNCSVQLSSLRLYADNTTAYASNADISALELSLNKDLENLSSWFAANYLSVNSTFMHLLFILATWLSK